MIDLVLGYISTRENLGHEIQFQVVQLGARDGSVETVPLHKVVQRDMVLSEGDDLVCRAFACCMQASESETLYLASASVDEYLGILSERRGLKLVNFVHISETRYRIARQRLKPRLHMKVINVASPSLWLCGDPHLLAEADQEVDVKGVPVRTRLGNGGHLASAMSHLNHRHLRL